MWFTLSFSVHLQYIWCVTMKTNNFQTAPWFYRHTGSFGFKFVVKSYRFGFSNFLSWMFWCLWECILYLYRLSYVILIYDENVTTQQMEVTVMENNRWTLYKCLFNWCINRSNCSDSVPYLGVWKLRCEDTAWEADGSCTSCSVWHSYGVLYAYHTYLLGTQEPHRYVCTACVVPASLSNKSPQ